MMVQSNLILIVPVAGCTILAAAPNARFFWSVFGNDPPTGIYDHSCKEVDIASTKIRIQNTHDSMRNEWH